MLENQKFRKVGFHMNILMGFSLSLCLSLTNTLSAEKPTLDTWLISFGVSALISFALSFLIPIKKMEDGILKKMHISPLSLAGKLIAALISDFIYTPVISLAMVSLVRFIILKQSHGMAQLPPFIIMFGKSLIVSFIVAYCVIFLINRPLLRLVLKMNGIDQKRIDSPPPHPDTAIDNE